MLLDYLLRASKVLNTDKPCHCHLILTLKSKLMVLL